MSYVYIIEFDGGLVKVGRTNNPKNRITAHAGNVRSVSGAKINKQWVSVKHSNYSENEANLINFCSSKFDKNEGAGREWFVGCNFESIVCYAECLHYSSDTAEKKTFDKEKTKSYLDGIFGSVEEKNDKKKLSLCYELAIKLELFIRESLWIGGEIFNADERNGLSQFVSVVAVYFYSGDPAEMLIDAVSQILLCGENEADGVHQLYFDACESIAKLWSEK
jgi:hypothetical protein